MPTCIKQIDKISSCCECFPKRTYFIYFTDGDRGWVKCTYYYHYKEV